MRGLTVFGLGMALAQPAAAQDAPQRFQGPLHYCGVEFATDLAADETTEAQHGPDFILERLIGPRGGFGIYEGSAPQYGPGEDKVEAGLGVPTYRLKAQDGIRGYVIWTGSVSHPFYLHVYGEAFKGTDDDFRLLKRLQFGDARHCARPSFDQAAK